MKVVKLPHAGMIVESGSTTIVFDPALTEIIEDTYAVSSPVDVDVRRLRKIRFDAIFISHAHEDHFNLQSLACFHRSIPIFVPTGERRIPRQLKRLGFKKIRSMSAGRPVQVGDIQVIPTPSRVSFPEVGFIVKNDSRSFWNFIDTRLIPADVDELVRRHGRPDAAFVSYQPTQESKVRSRIGLRKFPNKLYDQMLELALHTRAEHVIPSSWDLINFIDPELNRYLSPVSKLRFTHDIAERRPEQKTMLLNSGDSALWKSAKVKIVRSGADLKRFGLRRKRMKPIPKTAPTALARLGHIEPLAELKSAIDLFLTDRLPQFFALPRVKNLKREWAKSGMKWRLTLVFPDHSKSFHYVDFSKRKLAWSRDSIEHNYETIVAAADLRALVEGDLAIYAFSGGGLLRNVDRRVDPDVDQRDPLLDLIASDVMPVRIAKIIERVA